MTELPFALYDAFCDTAFGGSQAGIVCNAGDLDSETRLKIAKEFGWPATCFVEATSANSITARFQSTVREYPMCGHGTICLMTMMVENGVMEWDSRDKIHVELRLPTQTAIVEIYRQSDNRPLVMLDIDPPVHRLDNLDLPLLMKLLAINQQDLVGELPLETIVGDFTHLVVPIKTLEAMERIKPDFTELAHYCKNYGIETIATFCMQVKNPAANIHVRDFCPAVGVAESAAAGTTNAALTSYLMRHGLVEQDGSDQINVTAEQGLEIGRPSLLYSSVSFQNNNISRLQVGGVATKVLEGKLSLPNTGY